MQKKIHDLRGHSVICGFGRTGRVVADELHEDGFPFCVIEYNRDEEEALRDSGYLFVIGDATEEHVLEEAGIEHANAVLALLTSDADNLYLTINAKELNPKAKVVARALDDTAERRLKRAGADNVVATFKLSAHRVLQAAVRPTVNEFIELVGDRGQLSLIMEEIVVSAGSAVISQSLEKAGVRAQYGVIIVTIKKTGGDMIFNPPGTVTFEDGDTLIALGEEEGLQRLGAACRSV
jgi:voltage-gated potassium channel